MKKKDSLGAVSMSNNPIFDPRTQIFKYDLFARDIHNQPTVLLAHVYLAGRPNPNAVIGVDLQPNLAGAEIFFKPGQEGSSSVVLQCAPKWSYLKFTLANPSPLTWVLLGSDNRVIDIDPSAEFDLHIPCPLMWVDLGGSLEPIHVNLTLTPQSPLGPNPTALSLETIFYFPPQPNVPVNGIQQNGQIEDLTSYSFPLSQWGSSQPPYLLNCRSLCTAPKDDSAQSYVRTVSFQAISVTNSTVQYSMKCGLKRTEWPTEPPDVYTFAPFAIPIIAENALSDNGDPDFTVVMHPQWQNSDGIRCIDYKASWDLEANWRLANHASAGTMITPLRAWNRYVVDPYNQAILSVKGGLALSGFPHFLVDGDGEIQADSQAWLTRYDLADNAPLSLSVDGNTLTSTALSLEPTIPFLVHGNTPRLIGHDGLRLHFSFAVGAPPSPDASPCVCHKDSPPLDQKFSFRFSLLDLETVTDDSGSNTVPVPQPCRIGSLDLDFAQHGQKSSNITMDPESYVNVRLRRADQPSFPVDSIDAKIRYGIASIAPASQDPTTYEYQLAEPNRPRGLVIPYPGHSAVIEGPF
ncbi:MAG: hypothetical protein ACRD3W_06470, partial [Terriglobales bacterium]